VPALTNLLDAYEEIADLAPSQSNFQMLRDTAEKLAGLDPSDKHAAATQHLATIKGWLAGLQTDPRTVKKNLKALQQLHKEDPSNADLPYYIALVNVRRARDAGTLNDHAAAARLAQQTQSMFAAALKQQPGNAQMHYRAYQVDQTLSQLQEAKDAKATADQARHEIEQAQKLAKPQDDLYVVINKAAADELSRRGDRSGAETILRGALAAHPTDPAAQMALAQLLGSDPKTRSEAITLLSNPKTADQAESRREALMARQYGLISQLELVSLQIDEYADITDPAKKKAMLGQINSGYKSLEEKIGQGPDVLKLRGRLELAQGEEVKAIQTLEKVQQLLSQQGKQDFQVKYLLARAYLKVNQNGEAKKLLRQVIQKFPGMVEARLLLAQQLLKEHDTAGAAPQLAFLRKAMPDAPQVAILELAALNPKTDSAKAQSLYKSLPEKTAKDQLGKAKVAVQLGNHADAERLLKEAIAQEPGDAEAVNLLARLYVAENQKPQAVALVDAALKANPDDKSLAALKKVFAGATAKEIIESEADPLTRELNLAELAERSGNRKEAQDHLTKAAAIQPDSPRVLTAQFNEALAAAQWDDATKYADKLAAMNQDQAGGRLFRFRLAMAQKDLDKANQIASELTDQMPEFSQSWVALAQSLQARGQFNDALSKYLAALDRQEDNMDALNGVIQCYLAINRPQAAHDAIVKALERFPGNASFSEQLTQWQLTFGDPTKALPARQAAVKDHPDSPGARAALAAAYLRVAQVNGVKDPAARSTYVAKAKEVFQEAKQKWPDESLFYARLAEIDLADSQPAAAEAVLKELAARPKWADKPQPQLMLAELYQKENKLDAAEQMLRAAQSKAKGDFEVESRLANFLASRGKLDEALKILAADSSDPNVQKLRIELQVNGGRLADAQKAIEAQLAKDPHSASWRSLLGFVYMNSGKPADARKQLDQALAEQPGDAAALYYRGLLKMRQTPPDLGGAVEDLTAARNAQPKNVEMRLSLADALRTSRDNERAINELENVLQIDPQSKAARMKLIDLYAAAKPPRWSDADRIIAQTREMPELASDPSLLHQEAMVRLKEGRNAEALAAIEGALKSAPNDPVLTQAHLNILLAAGENQRVVQDADALLKKHEAWWLRLMRAEAQARLKDQAAALKDYEAALANVAADQDQAVAQKIISSISDELGPDEALRFVRQRASADPRWNIDVAYLLYHQHKEDDARRTIEGVLAHEKDLKPVDRVGALRLAGMIYMTGHPADYAKAKAAYVKLLGESPNDLAALNNLACLLAGNVNPPQPREARVYSQKAYDLVKQSGRWDPLVADTHGWILSLCDKDDLPAAIRILGDVVDRHPFPEARYHLAEAYVKGGKLDEAQKQLDQAIAALTQAKKDKQTVDPVLRMQIDQAAQRVREMQSKAEVR
jgi:tetratricopeptide (TPR) repeat protein